ncbi:hypothetical protein V6N11_029007 [Hibiscus sabdariffa]|uniref:Uncharacterized protein n=2 Tax=Hibiscus sabdariffa TaxID=183260 RepID=A0ABR2NWJ6_9ROSI
MKLEQTHSTSRPWIVTSKSQEQSPTLNSRLLRPKKLKNRNPSQAAPHSTRNHPNFSAVGSSRDTHTNPRCLLKIWPNQYLESENRNHGGEQR